MKEFNYDLDYLNKVLNDHHLKEDDKLILIDIIKPIYLHEEFQKRLNAQLYPHHGKLSLGNHILNDTIITYKICKRKIKRGKQVNLRNAVLIAMFHDLYESSWQNSLIKKSHLINCHGFTHPIEAIINAYTWFPEYFTNSDDALMIIDGILHHMFPFPVRSINNDFQETELNNLSKVDALDNHIKDLIIESTQRKTLGNVSFSKSMYLEGKIISRADKISTIKNEKKVAQIIIATLIGKHFIKF